MPTELTKADIKVGHTYRGKRFVRNSWGDTNDRTVIWVNQLGTEVQYDSSSVADGRRFPRVEMDVFLRWAKSDVTSEPRT
jgi:hypothetical protein